MVVLYLVTYFYPSVDEGTVSVVANEFGQDMCYKPSECLMFIPGTYAEMHADYD